MCIFRNLVNTPYKMKLNSDGVKHMKQEYKKYSMVIIVIFLLILSFLYMIKDKSPKYEFAATPITEEKTGEDIDLAIKEIASEEIVSYDVPASNTIEKVPIYVCGEVENPDVYYLYETAIVKEAIIAAGGFTSGADQDAWNLAMQIQNGLKIYVPKLGEQIDKIHNSYDNRMGKINTSSPSNQLININRADAQELMVLSGIGPVIAQNIIEYRDINGEFQSLEDVKSVPRIGQVMLEKIKDYICFQ